MRAHWLYQTRLIIQSMIRKYEICIRNAAEEYGIHRGHHEEDRWKYDDYIPSFIMVANYTINAVTDL